MSHVSVVIVKCTLTIKLLQCDMVKNDSLSRYSRTTIHIQTRYSLLINTAHDLRYVMLHVF